MKLSITKSEFLRGLGRIQSIVEKRNSMPILANTLIEAPTTGEDAVLQLAATDLEVGVRSQHTANVSEAGGLTVSAKKLFEIVRELSDEKIELEATANSYLEIRCNRSRFTHAGTAAEEYPTLPEFSPEKTVPVSSGVLSAMIERTMYAASIDETRYNLNGVYLEVLNDTDEIFEMNRVTASLRGPTADEYADASALSDLESCRARGLEAVQRGAVGALILNGGMATRFGGVVKAQRVTVDLNAMNADEQVGAGSQLRVEGPGTHARA